MIMVSSTLARALALLLLGQTTLAQSTCTRSLAARDGDTCASFAQFAGLTVTQFLRSNPGVFSCTALVAGASYCVEGTASGAAPVVTVTRSVVPIPNATGVLKITPDGSCGGDVTCAGSRYGRCCSSHGFCGSSADYCGEGCQFGLGECDDPAAPIPTGFPSGIVVDTSTPPTPTPTTPVDDPESTTPTAEFVVPKSIPKIMKST